MANATYHDEALKLASAIDIAIEAFNKHTPSDWTDANVAQFTKVYSLWKDDLLAPSNKYKNLTSLKYLIKDVFTFFQEGHGQTVEYFWQQIKAKGLDYERVGRVAKILKRKKIRDQIEYDNVIDVMLPSYQEGKITEEEYTLLNKCIEAFERKNSKR